MTNDIIDIIDIKDIIAYLLSHGLVAQGQVNCYVTRTSSRVPHSKASCQELCELAVLLLLVAGFFVLEIEPGSEQTILEADLSALVRPSDDN